VLCRLKGGVIRSLKSKQYDKIPAVRSVVVNALSAWASVPDINETISREYSQQQHASNIYQKQTPKHRALDEQLMRSGPWQTREQSRNDIRIQKYEPVRMIPQRNTGLCRKTENSSQESKRQRPCSQARAQSATRQRYRRGQMKTPSQDQDGSLSTSSSQAAFSIVYQRPSSLSVGEHKTPCRDGASNQNHTTDARPERCEDDSKDDHIETKSEASSDADFSVHSYHASQANLGSPARSIFQEECNERVQNANALYGDNLSDNTSLQDVYVDEEEEVRSRGYDRTYNEEDSLSEGEQDRIMSSSLQKRRIDSPSANTHSGEENEWDQGRKASEEQLKQQETEADREEQEDSDWGPECSHVDRIQVHEPSFFTTQQVEEPTDEELMDNEVPPKDVYRVSHLTCEPPLRGVSSSSGRGGNRNSTPAASGVSDRQMVLRPSSGMKLVTCSRSEANHSQALMKEEESKPRVLTMLRRMKSRQRSLHRKVDTIRTQTEEGMESLTKRLEEMERKVATLTNKTVFASNAEARRAAERQQFQRSRKPYDRTPKFFATPTTTSDSTLNFTSASPRGHPKSPISPSAEQPCQSPSHRNTAGRSSRSRSLVGFVTVRGEDGEGDIFDSGAQTHHGYKNEGELQCSGSPKGLWTIAMTCVSNGDLDEAFRVILSSDEPIQLVRLMGRVDCMIAVRAMRNETLSHLVARLTFLLRAGTFVPNTLPWLAEIIRLARNDSQSTFSNTPPVMLSQNAIEQLADALFCVQQSGNAFSERAAILVEDLAHVIGTLSC